eukprot:TRINITY_DN1139_c0_g1_i1.p1 TRINITY_DN1139_c0_g1~~TRINITY_DN1139_c0_g1_i1.p1  ORF type:complete len:249 (-),score=65.11 TRINITY_DN1139_c0_g1_i1:756-1481(-)
MAASLKVGVQVRLATGQQQGDPALAGVHGLRCVSHFKESDGIGSLLRDVASIKDSMEKQTRSMEKQTRSIYSIKDSLEKQTRARIIEAEVVEACREHYGRKGWDVFDVSDTTLYGPDGDQLIEFDGFFITGEDLDVPENCYLVTVEVRAQLRYDDIKTTKKRLDKFQDIFLGPLKQGKVPANGGEAYLEQCSDFLKMGIPNMSQDHFLGGECVPVRVKEEALKEGFKVAKVSGARYQVYET